MQKKTIDTTYITGAPRSAKNIEIINNLFERSCADLKIKPADRVNQFKLSTLINEGRISSVDKTLYLFPAELDHISHCLELNARQLKKTYNGDIYTIIKDKLYKHYGYYADFMADFIINSSKEARDSMRAQKAPPMFIEAVETVESFYTSICVNYVYKKIYEDYNYMAQGRRLHGDTAGIKEHIQQLIDLNAHELERERQKGVNMLTTSKSHTKTILKLEEIQAVREIKGMRYSTINTNKNSNEETARALFLQALEYLLYIQEAAKIGKEQAYKAVEKFITWQESTNPMNGIIRVDNDLKMYEDHYLLALETLKALDLAGVANISQFKEHVQVVVYNQPNGLTITNLMKINA